MKRISYGPSKRTVQEYIFSRATMKSVVGLPGANVSKYVSILKSYGFHEISLYENNLKELSKQIKTIPEGYSLTFGNVLAYIDTDKFNDLDFCASALSLEEDDLERISKLKEYSVTVSVRPLGKEETVSMMKKYLGDVPYFWYRDTSEMITFYKLLKL